MKKITFSLFLCLMGLLTHAQTYQIPQVNWNDTASYSRTELISIALKDIEWCYNTPMTTLKNTRQEVISFLMQWLGHSPELKVSTHADIIKCNNNNLLSMFLLGRAKYNIENKNTSEVNSILAGADFMIGYYDKNAGFFGKNKQIKKLRKQMDSGKWEKKLLKQFSR
ncbi:MAG: hypothetical protein J5701_00275 [Bacteroidales bacterium]|nr:hypothetical protein [Bacteroidales bacterium]